MADLNGVFKIINLAVGGLSGLLGLTQLVSGISFFFQGLYLICFAAGIIALEFTAPPLAYQYASFLYSFLGRGIFYGLIGVLVAHGNAIRIILGAFILFIGIGFAVLEFIPSIEPPENFRQQGNALEENEEDII